VKFMEQIGEKTALLNIHHVGNGGGGPVFS
jgi:hypothetical protein